MPQIWNLQKCSNGEYCCRDADSGTSCCDDDGLFDFNIGKFQAQATSTKTVLLQASGLGTQTVVPVTVTASCAPSCHAAESAQDSAGPASASCSGPSAVVVIGTVGGTLGVALLTAIAAIIFLCRRKPVAGEYECTLAGNGPANYSCLGPGKISAKSIQFSKEAAQSGVIHELSGEQRYVSTSTRSS